MHCFLKVYFAFYRIVIQNNAMEREVSGTAEGAAEVSLEPLKDALWAKALSATFKLHDVVFLKSLKAYATSHKCFE